LNKVILPDSISSIEESAFEGCNNLDELTLGNLNTIGVNAFSGCVSLTSVTIPNTLSSVADGAFYGCSSLSSVSLGSSVGTIGSSAFRGCTNLKTISIPSSVSYIQPHAFAETGLTSFYASNLYSIGDGAFASCNNLTCISVYSCSTCHSKDCVLYRLNKDYVITSVLQFPAGRGGEFEIPDYILSIDSYAFSGASKLNSVLIPESVSYIGSYAFQGCDILDNVTYLGESDPGFESQQKPNEGIFEGCDNLDAVCVTRKYKSDSFCGKPARRCSSSASDSSWTGGSDSKTGSQSGSTNHHSSGGNGKNQPEYLSSSYTLKPSSLFVLTVFLQLAIARQFRFF